LLSASYSPDGDRIVTGSEDGSAQLWDAETGEPIGGPLKGHISGVSRAAFSPDGSLVVTASWDKTARLWDVFANNSATVDLMARAKAMVPRCLTLDQRSRFFLPPTPPAWCVDLEKWAYHTAAWKAWVSDIRTGKSPSLPEE
jgi:WD40 repeat protein